MLEGEGFAVSLRLRHLIPAMLAPFCRWQARRQAGTLLRILTYHRVNNHRPGDRLSVPRELFSQHLDVLEQRNYVVLSLEEAVRQLRMSHLPSRAVCITFDDGYADNFTDAFPELEKRRLHATIFVTSGWVGQSGPIPGCRGETDDRDRALSWDELKTMTSSKLISIGSHTVTHPTFSEIPIEQIREELVLSKMVLEGKLGSNVNTFAYPRGDTGATGPAEVAAAGYHTAVTVRPGPNRAQTPPLLLSRTEVSAEDRPIDLRRKLLGAFDPLHRWLQAVKG